MESQGMNVSGDGAAEGLSQGREGVEGAAAGVEAWLRGREAAFVVLRHTGIGGKGGGGEGNTGGADHYDLLIDAAGGGGEAEGGGGAGRRVWTWRLWAEPGQWNAGTAAERVADHRLMYLSYEGAVSGDRGEVRRVARGVARLVRADAEAWEVRLSGELFVVVRLPVTGTGV